MDPSDASNPQHYQPLSHALHPPLPTPRSRSPFNAYGAENQQREHTEDALNTGTRREEEEEVEEEEEEEEEEVEGEVVDHNTSDGPLRPAQTAAAQAGSSAPPSVPVQLVPPIPHRRRPGRPKGSKNKKPRFDLSGSPPKPPFSTAQGQYFQYPHNPSPAPMQSHPPPHPNAMPSQAEPGSQQFYDFQWRVLTLCSEFYNAADELIRGAPPHVIAQCFSLPGNHVDPISILNDARRACDTLMANPSQTVLKPTPPAPVQMYSASPTTHAKPPVTPATPANVIHTPGTFVMSLGATPAHPLTPTAYPYPPPGRYPTSPYYYAPPPPGTQQPAFLAQQQMIKPVNLQTPAAAGNQGAWSEEETEKLRKLADESRGEGEQGDIDWDWVCNAWGPGRTRHQILIKATSMGMKESSTRGVKRRREMDSGLGMETESPAPPTASTSVSAPAAAPSTASSDQPMSAQASPEVAHQQPTLPSNDAGTITPLRPASGAIPWTLPHVAATTTPVGGNVTQSTLQSPTQAGRASYYRERPNQSPHITSTTTSSSKPPPMSPSAGLTLLYPNGTAGSENRS